MSPVTGWSNNLRVVGRLQAILSAKARLMPLRELAGQVEKQKLKIDKLWDAKLFIMAAKTLKYLPSVQSFSYALFERK